MIHIDRDTTICALSTAPGIGGIAVIRISGNGVFDALKSIFSKDLSQEKSHTVHFGLIKDKERIVDEVVVSIFKNPHSFTGENVAEISCHGSIYIQQEILNLLLKNGCTLAQPGEFTMRAFANGKMDLSQAEAIADIIASTSEAEHKLAMKQMRGDFSKQITELRQELMNFASLLELELDFSEEDVEFADRAAFNLLLDKVLSITNDLIDSFKYGNAIKNGIPVVIAGAPNAGKSTLLNNLLKEDKAIVSDIAGTTRDIIEDDLIVNGTKFRFIDTAGLRETSETIESIGIEKAYSKISTADVVLYLIDSTRSENDIKAEIDSILLDEKFKNSHLIFLLNKADNSLEIFIDKTKRILNISAKHNKGIDELKQLLANYVQENALNNQHNVVVTNVRHIEALDHAREALQKAKDNMNNGISSDFVAMDTRQALHHLGTITGEISTDDLLGNIFSKFCIGK